MHRIVRLAQVRLEVIDREIPAVAASLSGGRPDSVLGVVLSLSVTKPAVIDHDEVDDCRRNTVALTDGSQARLIAAAQ